MAGRKMMLPATARFVGKCYTGTRNHPKTGSVLGGLVALGTLGLFVGYTPWAFRNANDLLWKDEVIFPEGELNGRRVEFLTKKGVLNDKGNVMREWRNGEDFYESWDYDETPLGEFVDLERFVAKVNGERYVFDRKGKFGSYSYLADGKKMDDREIVLALDNLFEKAENRCNYNILAAQNRSGGVATSSVASAYKAGLINEVAEGIPDVPGEFKVRFDELRKRARK